MKNISKSLRMTWKIGADFARSLAEEGVMIGLTGDLGSGKTTFVQGMARGLGIDPNYYVNSPTFTMVNEYGDRLVHVDLYRIENPAGVETLAIEEYLGPGKIIVIEWPEKIASYKERLDFLIRFEWVSEKERRIRIEKRAS